MHVLSAPWRPWFLLIGSVICHQQINCPLSENRQNHGPIFGKGVLKQIYFNTCLTLRNNKLLWLIDIKNYSFVAIDKLDVSVGVVLM